MFVCFNAPKSEALSVLIWCTAELQRLIHFLLIPVCPPVMRLKQQVGFTHREAQATGDLTASLFCRSDRRIWHQSINELIIYTKKLHWFLKLGLWRRRAAEESRCQSERHRRWGGIPFNWRERPVKSWRGKPLKLWKHFSLTRSKWRKAPERPWLKTPSFARNRNPRFATRLSKNTKSWPKHWDVLEARKGGDFTASWKLWLVGGFLHCGFARFAWMACHRSPTSPE